MERREAMAAITNCIDGPAENEGYCIRCASFIEFNPYAPYCTSCWKQWMDRGGRDYYEEQHCHDCGAPSPVTKSKPVCGPCYY